MNAIMTDLDFKRGSEPVPHNWEGLAEIDRALAENRLTAYRWKKAWADPINRTVFIGISVLLIGIFGFLALG